MRAFQRVFVPRWHCNCSTRGGVSIGGASWGRNVNLDVYHYSNRCIKSLFAEQRHILKL